MNLFFLFPFDINLRLFVITKIILKLLQETSVTNDNNDGTLIQSSSSININETTLENQIQDAIDDIWSNIRITPYFDYLDNTTGKTDPYTVYQLNIKYLLLSDIMNNLLKWYIQINH